MPRILTLTMNPAVDVSTRTAKVEPTHKLRCGPALQHAGGGGINVARVVHRLGGDVRAVFPTGGLNGQVLCRLLQAEGVQAECVPVGGETRESFSVFEETSGKDWRFVLPGPPLTGPEAQPCLDRAAAAADGALLAVVSGSLPPGVPDDFYARLARLPAARRVPIALDSSGAALAAAPAAGVYLVKPSQRELNELTGAPLAEPAQRLAACRELIARGQAQVVALSLGDQGAMLVSRDGAWQAAGLRVQVASTIGAGDSFVGGMVHALQRGDALEAAFRQAMAASAAALLSPGTALCRPEDVARLLPEVRIRRIG